MTMGEIEQGGSTFLVKIRPLLKKTYAGCFQISVLNCDRTNYPLSKSLIIDIQPLDPTSFVMRPPYFQ